MRKRRENHEKNWEDMTEEQRRAFTDNFKTLKNVYGNDTEVCIQFEKVHEGLWGVDFAKKRRFKSNKGNF